MLGKTWPHLFLNNRCNDSYEETADKLEPVPELMSLILVF